MKMKTSKGTVALEIHQNRIRLRWSHEGKRYCFSPGLTSTKVNQKIAQNLANQIELDILSKNFDPTLVKYGKNPSTKILSSEKAKNLLSVWDSWVNTLELSPRTLNGHYRLIRRHIEKNNPSIADASWYEKIETLSPGIFNTYLGFLRRCLNWAVEQELTDCNPYIKVKRRKTVRKRVKPFTVEEIRRIIQAFRNDEFCPKTSAYKHSHYADYIEFLFTTGCRPSEAIGLQRKHIDLDRNEIVICSVLARSDSGLTNGSSRVRKETKTGNTRYLTMTPRLREILEVRCQNLEPEDLVFPSVTGKPIDDRMFCRRQWKPILEALNIEYRKPYITRHTLASTAIEQGIPLTSVAYLLGHVDTKMVMQNYGHMINRPELPNLAL